MNEKSLNDEILNKCGNVITEQLQKYHDSDYMIQRIQTHIINYLPNILENEFSNYEKRVQRNNYLTNEQQIFIQVFLSKNNYYYLQNNNFFYEYDGKNYFIIKEDKIIHNLLSNISKERILLQWKHRTKFNIIKQIKERNLFDSIPETDTIQNVLHSLYPTIFSTKNSAKYFLSILGDNILKKNNILKFLVSPNMKKMVSELDTVIYDSVGYTNVTFNFMTKYHENHHYENCRLIKINENYSNNYWRDTLKRISLDLICVATHYSKRYNGSDNFLNSKADDETSIYAYSLRNTDVNDIITRFYNDYLCVTDTIYKIQWKNIHFIWKQFLSNEYLPNIVYSNTLKNAIKEKCNYDETTDSFIGLTSRHLPIYNDFINFWEKNINVINIDPNNYAHNIIFEDEIEIDELCSLFKFWVKNNKNKDIKENKDKIISNGIISEENAIKILKHFFPNIEIIEDKYVLNINCILWNKIDDIIQSFTFIKEQIKKEHKLALISLDEAYNYYYKYSNNNQSKFIVSKRYFEKYIYFILSEQIVYDKFIETEWIINEIN